MKAIFLLLSTLLGSLVAPNPRFTCGECVDEMHHLGRMVKDGAEVIQSYLIANYCPGLDDSSLCEEHLAEYYVWMLEAIVNHFFVDGAVHICQTMGVCDARRYTCEECVAGMEWVESYMEDPIMVAECVMPGSTLVRNVWLVWSGWRVTWRTPKWWPSTWCTWSTTSAWMSGTGVW